MPKFLTNGFHDEDPAVSLFHILEYASSTASPATPLIEEPLRQQSISQTSNIRDYFEVDKNIHGKGEEGEHMLPKE